MRIRKATKRSEFRTTNQNGSEVANARNLLRSVGLRATAPRLAVLRMLLREPRPLSHVEIWHALQNGGFDRATVFRNLHDLVKAGVSSRVDVGDHTWRFERRSVRRSQPAEHSHFVCERCGSVACLGGVRVKFSRRASDASRIGNVSAVVLRGRCPACRASAPGG